MARENVAIIGGGIVGLAHAWSAAECRHRVTLFERSARASGASIRNFGMIWPIGQTAGEWHRTALESRQRWLQLAEAAGIWVNRCGSIHLAHRDDEWAVLQEFEAQAAGLGIQCSLMSDPHVRDWTPAANPSELRGGLFSPTELCVNPRMAVRQIPLWLAQQFGVRLRFDDEVVRVVSQGLDRAVAIETSAGEVQPFDRVVICGGSELRTLFPEVFADSGLKLCKLQMLKTPPQAADWKLGPHLASGLTLRHYRNFEICAGLAALRERIAAETPELDRFGIHVMASQNDAGELVLGDSHEYGDEIEPFDKSLIDELMMRELRKVICLPDWMIAERWHGRYVKHPATPVFEAEPTPGVHLCTGLGGAGMTLSFGVAERAWRKWSETATGN